MKIKTRDHTTLVRGVIRFIGTVILIWQLLNWGPMKCEMVFDSSTECTPQMNVKIILHVTIVLEAKDMRLLIVAMALCLAAGHPKSPSSLLTPGHHFEEDGWRERAGQLVSTKLTSETFTGITHMLEPSQNSPVHPMQPVF